MAEPCQRLHDALQGAARGNFLRLDVDGRPFTLTLEGAAARTGAADGAVTGYDGAFPGVRVEYRQLADGVEEKIVLERRDVPRHYRFLLEPPAGADLDLRRGRDGSWTLRRRWRRRSALHAAAAGRERDVGRGDHRPGLAGVVTMAVARVDRGFAIDLNVNARWLRTARLPVRIDPTFTVASTVPTRASASARGAPARTTSSTSCSSETRASTSGAAPCSSTSATFPPARASRRRSSASTTPGRSSGSGGIGVDNPIELHELTRPWSPLSTWQQLSDALDGNAPPLDTFTLPAGASGSTWLTWNVTSAVKSWSLAFDTNHGFLLKRDHEGDFSGGVRLIGRSYHEASLRPRLDVTWEGDGVDLHEPQTLHSDGADLSWTRYTGPEGQPFERVEIHRSLEERFTPNARTLLATIDDPEQSTYRDTTAAPGKTFTYRVVVNGSAPSVERTVTLPPDGRARKLLQPLDGKSTYITNGWSECLNSGGEGVLRVGREGDVVHRGLVEFDLRDVPTTADVDAATLSLWHQWTMPRSPKVSLHAVTSSWHEGTGTPGCTGDGATWDEREGTNVDWLNAGGDFEPQAAASVRATSASRPAGTTSRSRRSRSGGCAARRRTRARSSAPTRRRTPRWCSPTARPRTGASATRSARRPPPTRPATAGTRPTSAAPAASRARWSRTRTPRRATPTGPTT